MCLTVNFYEVFAPGTWVTGGWIEGIPNGRGIRHYDDVSVCQNTPRHLDPDVVVIPNAGLVQIERDHTCTHHSGTWVDGDGDDAWYEYDLTSNVSDPADVGVSMLIYKFPSEQAICTVYITVKERTAEKMNDPEDPHKSTGEPPIAYKYVVSEAEIRESH
jgi:hypothetical protein